MLADTITPVQLYLRLRDQYREAVLLESNNFTSLEDCHSFIGIQPIASFEVVNTIATLRFPEGKKVSIPVDENHPAMTILDEFLKSFQPTNRDPEQFNGCFGHLNFEAVRYFDTHQLKTTAGSEIPEIKYNLYRFIIAFNHFKDELTITENIPEGDSSKLPLLEQLIKKPVYPAFSFKLAEQETSNLTDEEFKRLVSQGKHFCQMGEVFQIVFSRQFAQQFEGDEFQVYRILRSINPSAYLFYFDFGTYRIFGSSPESQIQVTGDTARVNPIAGTFKRNGHPETDRLKAVELANDPKENAEHMMLVDLARNDLNRSANQVEVKNLKDIHYYSHVIHLVSNVTGKLKPGKSSLQVLADTFPAGTLSGAPKFRAIQLINQLENQERSTYGGAIGYIDFNGNINKAITIRSFLSKGTTLLYQAGAGIVVDSDEEKELQEVNHKLSALKQAMIFAERLYFF